MPSDRDFAEWAALFLGAVDPDKQAAAVGSVVGPAVGPAAGPESGPVNALITPAARELLGSVDAGGVPVFVTSNLRQIASDNGIATGPEWTPNDIIDALRRRAAGGDGVPGDDAVAYVGVTPPVPESGETG